jgi:hypothetical protein
MLLNIDNSKSYATEANLTAALAKNGLDKCNHLVVRNRDGRWTAVFPASFILHAFQGDMMAAARHGFKTIG